MTKRFYTIDPAGNFLYCEQDSCFCAWIEGVQVLFCPDHNAVQLKLRFD